MESQEPPEEIAPGLWSWARRHPDWHPGDFGAEVVSFMARAGGGEGTLLIDPLLDGDDDQAWELIAANTGTRIRVFVTITYHVRSAERIRDRFSGQVLVTIHGNPAVAKRLESTEGFEPFVAGDSLPAEVSAYAIGKPRRLETPLLIPSHRALVFGDAVAGTDLGPRIWSAEEVDERVLRFYRDRFAPTLVPLLDLDFDRLLLTHGPSLLENGKDGLREAIESPPWYHRG